MIASNVKLDDGCVIHHRDLVNLYGCTIGAGTRIGTFVEIQKNVIVGKDCKISSHSFLCEGVTLEDGVFCGPSCVFTNVNNPRAEVRRMDEARPTLVQRGASIGANATIVCGHTLGEYCFIGAGAVVTEDVPAYAVMAGVPARRIGWMSKAGGRLGDDLVCPLDGSRYELTSDGALKPIA